MKNSLVNPANTFLSQPQPIDQLYLGCLAQNPKSQRELFNRLSPKMLSICYRYIKETDAAEDVLIIAFGKIFSRISQFSSKGSFEGWIRRIVTNECLMYLEKKRMQFEEIKLDQLSGPVMTALPDDTLDWQDLTKMLAFLPKGYRTVFELFVMQGLSHDEIAKLLSISESTSKSQLSRARIQLQRLLQFGPRQN